MKKLWIKSLVLLIGILFLGLFFGFKPEEQVSAAPSACTLDVQIIAAPFAVVDSNMPGVQGPKVVTFGARITNTGPDTAQNVRAYIGNGTTPGTFTTVNSGQLALAPSETAAHFMGDLAPGASVTANWVLTYPFTYNVTYPYAVWASTGDGSCSDASSSTITTQSEISASANKILPTGSLLQIYPTTVAPGGKLTVQITGFTLGTIGSGPKPPSPYDAWLQPVGNLDFDASCLRLVKSEILLNSVHPTPFEDQLYFSQLTNYTNNSADYVKYTFIALRECSTVIQPYQEAASGTQEKYNADFENSTSRIQMTSSGQTELVVDINADKTAVTANETIEYTIDVYSTGEPVGSPESGSPVVVSAEIAEGTHYVNGTATSDVTAATQWSTDAGTTWADSEPVDENTVTDVRWLLSEPVDSTGVQLNYSVETDAAYVGDPITTSVEVGLLDAATLVADSVVVNENGPAPTPTPSPTPSPTPDAVQSGGDGGLESEPVDLPPSTFLGGTGTDNSTSELMRISRSPAIARLAFHKARLASVMTLTLEDLLPAVGPNGTTPTDVVPVDVLAVTTAPDAKAVDFVDGKGAVKAVVLGIQTVDGPYEHDYGVCNRFKEYTFDEIAPMQVAGNWYWQTGSHQGNLVREDALIFHVFVDEVNKVFHIDSRWIQDDYPADLGYTYDYVFNMQVWSSSVADSQTLLSAILENLGQVDSGTWSVIYHNQSQPIAPEVFLKNTHYDADIVRLIIQNDGAAQPVTLHGTWRSHLDRTTTLDFSYTLNVPAGVSQIALPFEGLLDTIIKLESGSFTDKVYVGSGLWFAIGDQPEHPVNLALGACRSLDTLNTQDLFLAGCAGVTAAGVSAGNQVGIGRTLNPNARPTDVSPYQALRFWAKGDGRPVRVLLETVSITDGDYYQYVFTPSSEWTQYTIPLTQFSQSGFGAVQTLSVVDLKAVIWLNAAESEGDFALDLDQVSFTNNSALEMVAQPLDSADTGARTVVADAHAATGIAEVVLYYSLDQGQSYQPIQMGTTRMPNDHIRYTGTIPAQSLGTDVWYYLETRSLDNYISRAPIDAPGSLFRYRVDNRPSLLVDDFAGERLENRLGGTAGFFNYAGGSLMAYRYNQQLVLDYAVPQDDQFAGLFTELGQTDASPYTTLDILVRGAVGGEHLLVGLQDAPGYEPYVSVGDLLPGGITTEWQWVQIPLAAFPAGLDFAQLERVILKFANDYPVNVGRVYVNEIRFTALSTPIWVDTFDDGNLQMNSQGVGYSHGGASSLLDVALQPGSAQISGGSALKLSYDVSPGGSVIWQTGLHAPDLTSTDELRFWVKGTASGLSPHLYLEDIHSKRAWVDLADYGGMTTDWRLVAIPLADFGAQGVELNDLRAIQVVLEYGTGSGTLWLDDISFSQPGDLAVDRRTLHLRDTDTHTLALHLPEYAVWQSVSSSSWLLVPHQGYGPASAAVRSFPLGLDVGTYTGQVTFSGPGGQSEVVDVTLEVTTHIPAHFIFLPSLQK